MSRAPSAETRDRILDAAEHAFSVAGLAGARVASIAQDADVNKAMLYYYFGSKEGLYTAVLERVADSIVHMADTSLAESAAPPAERMFAFLSGYRDLLASRPKVVRLMMHEVLTGGEKILPLVMARAPRVLSAFWLCVEQGQAQGTINPELDHRAVLPALLAPYVLFNIGSTVLGGRIPMLVIRCWPSSTSNLSSATLLK